MFGLLLGYPLSPLDIQRFYDLVTQVPGVSGATVSGTIAAGTVFNVSYTGDYNDTTAALFVLLGQNGLSPYIMQ